MVARNLQVLSSLRKLQNIQKSIKVFIMEVEMQFLLCKREHIFFNRYLSLHLIAIYLISNHCFL